jgi:hypothetical protein
MIIFIVLLVGTATIFDWLHRLSEQKRRGELEHFSRAYDKLPPEKKTAWLNRHSPEVYELFKSR